MKRPVGSIIRIVAAVAVVGGVAWVLQPRPVLVETATATRAVLV